ncbi:hypothetical protein ACTQZS_09985 [Bilifractor sp. LCP19S3_H10]|uniref:hypothetical protein n=1 Tax=Bilifractor sp. LCP19S3_H10 TaxID=3438736 RepID=UPI003F90DE3F
MEIERKWMVKGWPEKPLPLLFEYRMRQGYLSVTPTVRIREESRSGGDTDYILCFKSSGTLARKEIELSISEDKFRQLEDLIHLPLIPKIRRTYLLSDGSHLEVNHVDEGQKTEFWYAEIEFPTVEAALSWKPEDTDLSAYLNDEVTGKPGQSMGAYWVQTRCTDTTDAGLKPQSADTKDAGPKPQSADTKDAGPEPQTTDTKDAEPKPQTADTEDSVYGKYKSALKFVMDSMTDRIRAYNDSFRSEKGEGIYEHLSARIKSEESMREKCRRKGLPETPDSALNVITDAIGIRIVTRFIDDIYAIIRHLKASSDLTVITEKDYIRNAKPNGYRSYHMILKAAVPYEDVRGNFPGEYYVEIQLRTIAMDMWASLEHQLKYKQNISNASMITSELKRCADELASCDVSMQTIRTLINGDATKEQKEGTN